MNQKSLLLFLLVQFTAIHLFAQNDTPTDEQKEAYRKNQFKIDKNHGGIGVSFFRPRFGEGVQVNQPWVGVNVLADFFEVKFGTGKVQKIKYLDPLELEGFTTPQESNYGTDHGYMLSLGASVPLTFLAFGSQKDYKTVFRGHPILGIGSGLYGLKDSTKFAQREYDNIWFFYLTPGYRIRLPYLSVDVNFEMWGGMRFGNTSDFYKPFGFYPSITLRADALKGLLNPRMVSVNYTQTTVTNYQSNTTKSTSYSRDGRYKTTRYTTTTTGTVNVTSGQMGIQDVGPIGGVGAKYMWTPVARRPYMNAGRMFGINAYTRAGPLDVGVNFEGGRIGHGSELEAKNDEGKYRRKVKRNNTAGVGSISMGTAYINIGMDISSLFLLPFGVAMDKGDATSFLSASAGMIFGGHVAFNQEFDNPLTAQTYYTQELEQHPEVKPKFIDPAQHEATGFLTGFYFSLHVGALNFTVQNNRYYGAPFASGTMFGLAYRYPIPTF
jgi:hypothetical protein